MDFGQTVIDTIFIGIDSYQARSNNPFNLQFGSIRWAEQISGIQTVPDVQSDSVRICRLLTK